jgi:hypothetical protein
MSETKYLLDDVKATAPRNEVGSGNISTNKLGLIGTDTLFKTELLKGAYIIDFNNDELRKVVDVISDTYAILESAFTTDIPDGSVMDYIPAWKSNVREIAYIIPVYKQDNTTENDWGVVDGTDVPPGVGDNTSKAQRDRSSGSDVVAPVIMDATGTQILVTLTF